jgi:diguanylate cyclase (GGDEF)-like protein
VVERQPNAPAGTGRFRFGQAGVLRLYHCIADQHDLRLVILAALIALLGAYTGLTLLRHAATFDARRRRPWLAAAAIAAGAGAWATHFVSMCAFVAGFEMRYAAGLTALSLLIVVFAAAVSFSAALASSSRLSQAAAGGLFGLGVATMHYTGMAALAVPGLLDWDSALVATSFLAAIGLAALALPLCLGGPGQARLAGAVALFAFAICALHFLGMAALSFHFAGGAQAVGPGVIAPSFLAVIIAIVCFVMLMLSLAALYLNQANATRSQAEQDNLRDLADIAVEGLIVCDGPTLVSANSSFAQMTGYGDAAMRRLTIATLFEGGLFDTPHSCRTPGPMTGESVLVASGGERIPVEIVGKAISYAGKPHQVLALRDLRERRKADAAIRFLAHNDSLTGVANRASFSARLLARFGEPARDTMGFAVFALDLDRFKEINDGLGHHTGDLLLKRVADRLRATVRDTDLVARLGGDEFAILVSNHTNDEKALVLAKRIVEVVGRPYIIEGKIANIGASVGFALAPQDGVDPIELMKNADRALYRAKSSGKNTARRYQTTMDLDLLYRRTLELDLRRAIVQGEMVMFYQPLLDLRRQSIRGFEALIRWRHPTRGMVSPADFIPLAEETGLITRIGDFVLAASTMQAATWDERIGVAVNLSAMQFAGGQLVETVRAALARSGLTPGRLELEITESVLLNDGEDTLRTLHQLRDLGVRIAMDDFGTGYSSLRYVRSFPFDRIKIDRSFIQEILTNNESAAIVSAVVALSRRLGIFTTAEGVETAEQMARVREEGCDTAQGYLIGKPSPVAELGRFLPVRLAETA